MEIKNYPSENIDEVLSVREFPQRITAVAPSVAILMTQKWCPQYGMIKKWLENDRVRGLHPELTVFVLEYDGKPWFDRFLDFKENILKNALIPYVRYYRNGKYLGDSNYVSPDIFYGRFGGENV